VSIKFSIKYFETPIIFEDFGIDYFIGIDKLYEIKELINYMKLKN
jgi:hypothetical protein